MNYDLIRAALATRPKSFAVLAALLLANLVLVLYLVLWQNPELAKAQGEWSAKREAAAGDQNLRSAERYSAATRDLALFDQRLIPKQGFPAFLSQLFQTAHNDSLQIKGITYKPTELKDQGMITYGIAFTVSGRYGAVKGFLGDLARYPQMVTLDSVSLTNPSRTEEQVDLKIQMTAYLKQEGA